MEVASTCSCPGKTICIHFQHDSTKLKSLSDDRVNDMYEDSQSNFWIATEDGLNLFNREGKTFKTYQHSGFSATKAITIRLVKEDRQGNLLLGTAGDGLIVFNEKEKIFKQYRHQEKDLLFGQ
jgi:ligand-binding sensor domain-containing protein